MPQPVGLRDLAQHAGGDDRVRQDAGAREGRELGGLLSQDRAELVAGQSSPAAGDVLVRDCGAAATGVGVDGDHQVGVGVAGLREGKVESAGLLGVGGGDGGEAGVGVELLGHDDHVQAHAAQRVAADPPAHSVQGSQDDLEGGGGAHPRRLRRSRGVVLDDLLAQGLPAGIGHRYPGYLRYPDYPGRVADRLNALGDRGLVGRRDLRALPRAGHGAPAQVDRESVDLGRGAGGRHHDRGVGLEAPEREGEGRGGAGAVEQDGAAPRAGDDGGRVAGEDARVAASVVTDHDGETLAEGFAQISRQAGSGADDDGAIHPVRPRSQRAAQAVGTERQGVREGVGQGCGGLIVAGLVGGQQSGQLFAGGGVGVLIDPGSHGNGVERAIRAGHDFDATASRPFRTVTMTALTSGSQHKNVR